MSAKWNVLLDYTYDLRYLGYLAFGTGPLEDNMPELLTVS